MFLRYAKEVYEEAGLEPVGSSAYRDVKTGKLVAGQAGDLIMDITMWRMVKEEMIRRHI